MLVKEINTADTAPSSIANSIMLSVMLKSEKMMIVSEIYYKNIEKEEQMLKLSITRSGTDYFYNVHHSGKYSPSSYTKSADEHLREFLPTIVNDLIAHYFDRMNMGLDYNPSEDRVVEKVRIYKYDVVECNDKTYTKLNIDAYTFESILETNALYQLCNDDLYENMVVKGSCICPVDDTQLTFRIDIEKNVILKVPHYSLRLSKYNSNNMKDNVIFLNYITLSEAEYESKEELYKELYSEFEQLVRAVDRLSFGCAIGEVTIESYLLENNKNK